MSHTTTSLTDLDWSFHAAAENETNLIFQQANALFPSGTDHARPQSGGTTAFSLSPRNGHRRVLQAETVKKSLQPIMELLDERSPESINGCINPHTSFWKGYFASKMAIMFIGSMHEALSGDNQRDGSDATAPSSLTTSSVSMSRAAAEECCNIILCKRWPQLLRWLHWAEMRLLSPVASAVAPERPTTDYRMPDRLRAALYYVVFVIVGTIQRLPVSFAQFPATRKECLRLVARCWHHQCFNWHLDQGGLCGMVLYSRLEWDLVANEPPAGEKVFGDPRSVAAMLTSWMGINESRLAEVAMFEVERRSYDLTDKIVSFFNAVSFVHYFLCTPSSCAALLVEWDSMYRLTRALSKSVGIVVDPSQAALYTIDMHREQEALKSYFIHFQHCITLSDGASVIRRALEGGLLNVTFRAMLRMHVFWQATRTRDYDQLDELMGATLVARIQPYMCYKSVLRAFLRALDRIKRDKAIRRDKEAPGKFLARPLGELGSYRHLHVPVLPDHSAEYRRSSES